MGVMVSPLTGTDGNVEFVLCGRAPGAGVDRPVGAAVPLGPAALSEALDAVVAEASSGERRD